MKTIDVWNKYRVRWDEILIDDEDFERVNQYSWSLTRKYYNSYAVRANQIILSRFIMRIKDPKICVDHIDGNTLNNQKSNLRICSTQENLRNKRSRTDTYKGITYNGFSWLAQIQHRGLNYYLGSHDTPEKAAKAYDAKAKELFGEFARLNFPEDK